MGSETKSFFLNFKSGQIMVFVLLILIVVTILTASMYTRLGQFILFNDRGIDREQGLALADAGLEYAIYKLNTPPVGTYTGSELLIGAGKIITSVSPADPSGNKTITSTACIPPTASCAGAKTKREVQVKGSNIIEIPFPYALQSDRHPADIVDGIVLRNSPSTGTTQIIGNVSSNGDTSFFSESIRGDNCTTSACQIGGNAYAVKNISPKIGCAIGYTCSNFPNQSPKPMPQFNPADYVQAAENGEIIDCTNFADDIPFDGICSFFGPGITTLGPAKITGDVYVTNSHQLQVAGPIYITGELRLLSDAIIYPNLFLGKLGTVIIAAVNITINSATINTNAGGGYLLLYAGYVTNPSCSSTFLTCNIGITNLKSGSKAILWAANKVQFVNAPSISSNVTGAILSTFQYIQFFPDTTLTITYDPALSKARFFKDNYSPVSIIPGSYKIKQ